MNGRLAFDNVQTIPNDFKVLPKMFKMTLISSLLFQQTGFYMQTGNSNTCVIFLPLKGGRWDV